MQSLRDIALDRSNAELEVGYAVSPLVSVRALAAWGRTHGGITFGQALERLPTDPYVFLDHDRLLASRYWHVGGGATIALTDLIDLDASVVSFLAGASTHYGWGATFGATWRFLPSVAANPAKRISRPVRGVRRSPRPTPWR
ncbi:MAG: hypothetical protein HYS05_20510 [Acidobacteria bacterium]|nr:hypothetical protein [Acidobacteriota bacterium]